MLLIYTSLYKIIIISLKSVDFPVLDEKNPKFNGGRKNNFDPISGKINEGDQKVYFVHNSGKVDEGVEIKKTLDVCIF